MSVLALGTIPPWVEDPFRWSQRVFAGARALHALERREGRSGRSWKHLTAAQVEDYFRRADGILRASYE